jgi:endo-1,4-beta-xylanase
MRTAVAANPKGTVTNITYGSSYVARVYTPPGYSKGQAYPTMYLLHGMGGSEASILINELIPYVEANYCVSTDPNNRALGGLSMGGMQTINIGFPNADKFHYLMPSSPAPGIQGQSQLFPNGGALAKANLKLAFFTCGSGKLAPLVATTSIR